MATLFTCLSGHATEAESQLEPAHSLMIRDGLLNGGVMFKRSDKDSSPIGFSDKLLTVVTFIAPETGHYLFQVKGGRIGAHGSEDQTFGLKMAVFRWGKDRGTPLKSTTALKEELTDLYWEVEVELTAGEEVTLPRSPTPRAISGAAFMSSTCTLA